MTKMGKNGNKKRWRSAAECVMQMYQAFTALIFVQQRFLMFCSHVDGVDDRRAKEKKSTDIGGCDIYYGGMTCEQMRATEMQITIGLRQCSVTNIVLKIVILKIMVMMIIKRICNIIILITIIITIIIVLWLLQSLRD